MAKWQWFWQEKWKFRAWIAIVIAMVMMVLPYSCMEMNYIVEENQQWNIGVNYTI